MYTVYTNLINHAIYMFFVIQCVKLLYTVIGCMLHGVCSYVVSVHTYVAFRILMICHMEMKRWLVSEE